MNRQKGNAMHTLADLISHHGITVDDHLDRELDIPVLTGLQRQGDVIVIPTRTKPATTPVPAAGTAVVRGENGGNTHAIVGSAFCDVRTATAERLTLAVLTVPEVAYLAHPEHAIWASDQAPTSSAGSGNRPTRSAWSRTDQWSTPEPSQPSKSTRS